VIRLGTRGSDLALRQSSMVTERLRAAGAQVEVVIIQTRGDQSDRPFRELEGKAFFTKELDEALLDRKVDLAIHSLKDLPTEDPLGLLTICVLPRADSRDVLLLRREVTVLRDASGLALPRGIRLGTSSARRFAQIELAFPGVQVVDLRGNVPTRVAKLRRGEYDGILIAAAGVERLGLDLKDLTAVRLDPPQFLPAPGQGVLAARVRLDDRDLADRIRVLTDPETETCARAERGLLEKLDGGCSLPLGTLARRVDGKVVLDSCLAVDGRMKRSHVEAAGATEAAELAALELAGEEKREANEPLAPVVPTVLVTRPDGLDQELSRALRDHGVAVVSQPAIRFETVPVSDGMRAAMRALDQFDLVAFTSRHAVRAFFQTARKLGASMQRIKATAALGKSTAGELERHGLNPTLTADGSGGLALAELLANRIPAGAHVLHPGPAEPEPAFGERLARTRIKVTPLPLYQTRPVLDDPELPPGLILAIVASPSAARGLLSRHNVRVLLSERPRRLHLIAGGATTAAELQRLRQEPAAIAHSPMTDDVLIGVAEALEKLAREVNA
jgi:hydroxymethylbilane synthase